MPAMNDKDEVLNDIYKKINDVSKNVKSLFSMEQKDKKLSSISIAKQEEKDSEEELVRDEEKQYRIKTVKLLEEIRDRQSGEVGAAGGGGLGGLLSGLIGGGLGSIGSILTAALAPLLVGLAAAGLGTLLYEKFIKPELDEVMTGGKNIITKPLTRREEITSDKGEQLFLGKDESTGKSKVFTSTEKQTQIEKGASEIDFMPIQSQIQETREGGIQDVITTAPNVIPISLQGAKKEDIEKAIQEKESKTIAEEEGFRGREGKLQRYAQQIAMWEYDLRERLEDLATTELKIASTPAGYTAALAEGNRQQEILQNQIVNESNALKTRIKNDVGNTITERDQQALYSISDLFAADQQTLINKITAFRKETDGSIFDTPLGDSIEDISGKVTTSVTNNLGQPTEILRKSHKAELSLHELMQNMESKKKQAEVSAASKMYSAGGSPMANEGIIEGTRRGSRIIAGENYTSEAVVSTKPNTVTETIGKNLYDTIKQNASDDIGSTYRQSAVINDVLKNTIQSYYDITKISPLNTQGNQTIVNNFMGGMGVGNIPETNSHFNSMGLTPNNTETILQKVYMDTYKAALL